MIKKNIDPDAEFDDDPEMIKKIIKGIDWVALRQSAMDKRGFVVEAYRGWIVRTYADGHRERIHKI